MTHRLPRFATCASLVAISGSIAFAQTAQRATPPPGPAARAANAPAPTLPVGYVIGSDDVLSIVFWRDKDMSADVVVRPDGKITLPLLNEVQAAGLTPEQLRLRLTEAATKYVEEPTPSVVVKEIRSRNVYVTGNVAKPSTYALNGDTTVLQLIAMAGGLQEYADSKHIVIIRTENGKSQYLRFNYNDVLKQKNPAQNIVLRPGDTVVVP